MEILLSLTDNVLIVSGAERRSVTEIIEKFKNIGFSLTVRTFQEYVLFIAEIYRSVL